MPKALIEPALAEAIAVAEMSEYRPTRETFCFSRINLDVIPIDLTKVEPPTRNPGVVGIRSDRALSILNAIKEGRELPPLEVEPLPKSDNFGGYVYRVRDGYHRFHIALALGFTHVPVVERPIFSWDAL